MDEHPTRSPGAASSSGLFRRSAWIAIAVLIAGAFSVRFLSTPEVRSETKGSQPPGPVTAASLTSEVHALARLEPLSGLIVVGARPGARIEHIKVSQENQVVAGQLLAILEGHDQARAQLALAESQKARALHQRSLEKQKLTLEREKFDKLQKARNDLALRVLSSKGLFDDVTFTFKELQPKLQGKDRLETELKYLEAENQNIKDSLEVKSFQIAGELTPKQRKLEDDELGDQNPDLEIVDRQIDLARSALAQTEVHAPSAGNVLEIMAHPGEVSGGPLLALGDITTMAAVAEVFQTDVPRLKAGDAASVQILDESVAGRVTQIGMMVSRNQLTSVDPRALQDRRVVKVKIRLNDSTLAAKLVNMEVEVTITPGQPAPEPRASRP